MKLSTAGRILNDPLSWIHPSRVGVPQLCYGSIARGIINKIVVEQFMLEQEFSSAGNHGLAQTLIDNWFLLREAGWYMACQRYRAQILQSEMLATLSPGARSFMMLNIIPAISDNHKKIDYQNSELLAWLELLPLFSRLSPEMVKRIRLLFPADMQETPVTQKTDFDVVLFMMAIQHARKVSTTL